MSYYRRDIDGLRAVAVMPVVFSHSGIPGFSGGFIGVDVFFVISGFLITGILMREIDRGEFSIAAFYVRRARRILPALFALLAVCLAGGYFLFPPWQYEDLAASSLATIFFTSNAWFWHTTGDYFGTRAEFEPLLHTWSLAVEEQFYIAIPLLLWFLARWGRRAIVATIAGITALSFGLSVWAMDAAPLFNFFMTPNRAWELGAGALLALGFFPMTTRQSVAETVAALGLASIIASILFIGPDTPFPGLTALPACFGATAIIWAGSQHSTWTGRLLSTPAFVGIGLISFSLYLWHWPPLVLARIFSGSPHIDLGLAALVIIFAIIMAYLSWRFVEQPFRRSHAVSGRAAVRVFLWSGLSAAVLAGGSSLILYQEGFTNRVPEKLLATYEEASKRSKLSVACRFSRPEKGMCRFGENADNTASPEVFVWGDSHAGAVLPGIETWVNSTGQTAESSIKNGCSPVMNLNRKDLGAGHQCAAHNDGILNYLTERTEIETVILVGRWALLAEGTRAPGESGGPIALRLAAPDGEAPDSRNNADLFAYGLRKTVQTLHDHGKRVVLIEGIPEIGFDVPQSYLSRDFLGIPVPHPPSREAYVARHAATRAIVDDIAQSFPIIRHDVGDILCTSRCLIEKGGHLIYRDDDHFSIWGATWLMPQVLQ